MDKKWNKKESPLPMIVLLITLGIGMIVLVMFVFLGDQRQGQWKAIPLAARGIRITHWVNPVRK